MTRKFRYGTLKSKIQAVPEGVCGNGRNPRGVFRFVDKQGQDLTGAAPGRRSEYKIIRGE